MCIGRCVVFLLRDGIFCHENLGMHAVEFFGVLNNFHWDLNFIFDNISTFRLEILIF
jgi:hypothetical protein